MARSCDGSRTSVTEKRSREEARKVVTLRDPVDLRFEAVERSWTLLSDNLRVNFARPISRPAETPEHAGHGHPLDPVGYHTTPLTAVDDTHPLPHQPGTQVEHPMINTCAGRRNVAGRSLTIVQNTS
jgi:hypothetical protein